MNPSSDKPKLDEDGLKRAVSAIPKHTLTEALAIAQAIEDTNAGQPLRPADTATAVKLSPRNSKFEQITSASIKYGLTTGNSRAGLISITQLGQRLVSATSAADRANAMLVAALTPETFQQMYDFFAGKKLPESQYLQNIIARQFGIHRDHAAQCADVFVKNMEVLNLIATHGGYRYLSSQAKQPKFIPEEKRTVQPVESGEDDFARIPNVEDHEHAPPRDASKKRRPNKLFVGYGLNHKPVEQLSQSLTHFGIPYLIAEERTDGDRPISQNVREKMEQCGAAILIFSADVEYYDKDRNSVWLPSENAAQELGAASAMYDDRIIVLREESVTFAGNYSGVGCITFEKDKLDAKISDLLCELVARKVMKMSFEDDD